MLKKIRRSFSLVFIFVSMLVGFWVYAENSNPVELTLLGFTLDQKPLGLLVIVTFASGIVLGLFCNVLVTSWMMFRIKRMQKQIQGLEVKSAGKKGLL